MLLAKVENARNTLLVEFPCKRMMLAEHLASIGISKPASQILCTDEDSNPIKVKIYGESEFGNSLAFQKLHLQCFQLHHHKMCPCKTVYRYGSRF